MARARHAKRNPAATVVPVVVVAAVVVAAVSWWHPWTESNPSAVPVPAKSVSVGPGASESSSDAAPSPSASDSASASPTGSQQSGTAAALRQCRSTVADGDAVVAAARQGISHWKTHVQAQSDADKGRIDADELGVTFARTRVAGNDQDTPLWARVTTEWDADPAADDPAAACRVPDGASSRQTAAFERCQPRAKALLATVEAADDGMADWMTHLTHMRASRDHYVHNAQGIWINDYDHAAPHIDAWGKADRKYQKLADCS